MVAGLAGQLASGRDIFTPVRNLKHYDEYTFTHALNVSLLATAMARTMEAPERMVVNPGIYNSNKKHIKILAVFSELEASVAAYDGAPRIGDLGIGEELVYLTKDSLERERHDSGEDGEERRHGIGALAESPVLPSPDVESRQAGERDDGQQGQEHPDQEGREEVAEGDHVRCLCRRRSRPSSNARSRSRTVWRS